MNIELCKQEIKRHEGEVLKIYEDSLGYKTLGIGHLCQPEDPEYSWEVGTKVSQEVVDMYYEQDFEKHYKETIHVFGSEKDFENLPEPIQRVLVNMCFNLGGTRLSKFKNMLKACKNITGVRWLDKWKIVVGLDKLVEEVLNYKRWY